MPSKYAIKAGLKLNIQKTKIIASSPIASWQIDGETMETVTEFILGASKSLWMVTAAMKLKDVCSLEEKYDKAVYGHPVFLTYTQNTSCEILGWMSYKLESRLLGEISTTSDMQMIPL